MHIYYTGEKMYIYNCNNQTKSFERFCQYRDCSDCFMRLEDQGHIFRGEKNATVKTGRILPLFKEEEEYDE